MTDQKTAEQTAKRKSTRGQRRPKHIPQRTCIACREKDAKREFVRIVRTPDQSVEVDPTGKKNGRGAYLCTRRSCWEKAISGSALERALNVTLDQETRERLYRYADHHFRDE